MVKATEQYVMYVASKIQSGFGLVSIVRLAIYYGGYFPVCSRPLDYCKWIFLVCVCMFIQVFGTPVFYQGI